MIIYSILKFAATSNRTFLFGTELFLIDCLSQQCPNLICMTAAVHKKNPKHHICVPAEQDLDSKIWKLHLGIILLICRLNRKLHVEIYLPSSQPAFWVIIITYN